MIDCGADWLGRLRAIAPTAIVLTHAHPDHAGGLAEGAPCPVYATSTTQRLLNRFPINNRRTISTNRVTSIAGVRFKAYRVEHSILAPAVGYRVSAGTCSFFYLPDVAKLANSTQALRGVGVYIGDGASLQRSMVRTSNTAVIGHAPISRQLVWCAKAHVNAAIFTHCGSPIVREDARAVGVTLHELGQRYGIDARFARDGEQVRLVKTVKSRNGTTCR